MKRRFIDMIVRVLILVAVLNGVVACQTTAKGSFCQVSSPIRLSSQAVDALSDAEVKAVLAHNRKGTALCHWRA